MASKWAGRVFAMVCVAASAQGGFKPGDKVKVWVSADYYDGTVVQAGSGDHAGQYLIHFDKFSNDQWALARNVAARAGGGGTTTAAAPATAGPDAAPRAGDYACVLGGGSAGSQAWRLELQPGKYQQHKPDLASGQWKYDAAGKRLEFTSGPYAGRWIGLFSAAGHRHKVLLRPADRPANAKPGYADVLCGNG
ncbi:hypothetical protein [Ramlibacter humi]|uniref:Uncharacterized protein n=1 Tax=Ramlibacter humi TaxID=2530451 RepID=A0A4Z0BYY4_9BURK|nr:hypothetical protein [Ramlibacter humi]TFZ03744.1 hypothetical protein EZ216_08795 [Ramlibacter humi]